MSPVTVLFEFIYPCKAQQGDANIPILLFGSKGNGYLSNISEIIEV